MFSKFTGKHLSQAAACNFIEKETLGQVFSCEFCLISKNTFFTERIWATASGFSEFDTRNVSLFHMKFLVEILKKLC